MTESVTNQPKSSLTDAASASLNKPVFERTMHQPPRIDEFGFNANIKMRLGDDGSNILKSQNHHLPTWWKGDNLPNGQNVKTNTELQETRRLAKIPDISFDLDGDGNVGGRDYVISKLFDKDGDGKLNAQERKAADEAVRNVSFNLFLTSVFVGY
jgi:hypothetical protein